MTLSIDDVGPIKLTGTITVKICRDGPNKFKLERSDTSCSCNSVAHIESIEIISEDEVEFSYVPRITQVELLKRPTFQLKITDTSQQSWITLCELFPLNVLFECSEL